MFGYVFNVMCYHVTSHMLHGLSDTSLLPVLNTVGCNMAVM